MENIITFKWTTGQIAMPIENIITFSAAKLKELIKTADANHAEVIDHISEYLTSRIDALNPDSDLDKPVIEKYEKLLSAVCGKKQTKQEKAIARIIKNCTREQFAGAMYENGKQVFLDGYRLVRFSAPIDFKPAKETFSAEKCIGDINRYNQKLNLPELKELKKAIALAKHGVDSGRIHTRKDGRRKTYMYDFGYGLPLVNALYLVDMLEALPNCEAFCIPDILHAPVYFSAGEDDGILLPIRKEMEYESAPIVPVIETAPETITAAIVESETVTEENSVSVPSAQATKTPEEQIENAVIINAASLVVVLSALSRSRAMHHNTDNRSSDNKDAIPPNRNASSRLHKRRRYKHAPNHQTRYSAVSADYNAKGNNSYSEVFRCSYINIKRSNTS